MKEILGGVKTGVVFWARKSPKVDFFEIPQKKSIFCIVFVSNFPPSIFRLFSPPPIRFIMRFLEGVLFHDK
jgi:hypothetical protein